MKKMAETVRVAPVDEIQPGGSRSVEVGEKLIGVFNVDGEFYAIDGRCTHVGAPMVDGWLDGRELTCPFHGARFDVTTGKALSPPATCDVDMYPVRVKDGYVVVELES
jgi:nitrite reductase/ring-hydroxylating ferredoxin subunit